MLESEIEAKLTQGIKRLGGRAYKWISPGNNGVPDRIIVLPGGKVLFVELKTESGRLSAPQKKQIKTLSDMGVGVTILYGLDAVKELLAWAEQEVSR